MALLFRLAEEAIRGDAEEIVVTFDPLLGVPRRVYTDRTVGATDDESDIVISHIEVAG